MRIGRGRLTAMLLCLVLAAFCVQGYTGKPIATGAAAKVVNADETRIDEESMMRTLGELSAERYGGRLAGTEGNEAAAAYIAEAFREIGLSNPKGLENYMQRYLQPVIMLRELPALSIEGEQGETVKEFRYVEDFTLRSLSSTTNNIDIKAPLFPVTNLSQLTPENQEVKGKLLLISWRLRGEISFYSLVEKVHDCGAAGALGEYDTVGLYRASGALTVTPMLGPWLAEEHSPFINVGSNTYKELLAAYEKGQRVQYRCSFTREDGKPVPNVVGLIEGSDPRLKDQYIIIGAHFDHVGHNFDGSFNPGSLDNASGVASMLEVARVLKESNIAPGKSVIFIAFNGEEGGLWGSGYYATNPLYPLDGAKMICMDMVGSSEKLPLTLAIAEGGGSSLQEELSAYCRELGIQAEKKVDSGSDHASFADVGVESVLLINEDLYNGYHTPEDTPEDVDKNRLEQVTKLVLHYLDKNAY